MKHALLVSRMSVVLFCVCILALPGRMFAQSGVPLKDRYQSQADRTAIDYYSERVEPYYGEVVAKLPKPPTTTNLRTIVVPATAAISGGSRLQPIRRAGERSGAFSEWREGVDWVEWSFTVARRGVYEIDLDYFVPRGGSNAAVRTLMVDGEVPFLEAYKVSFYRYFRDQSEPTTNNIGDEVRPRQIEVPEWRTVTLRDSIGMYDEPYRFEFYAGEHSIRMLYVDEDLVLGNLTIRPAVRMPDYADVALEYANRAYRGVAGVVQIQAESTVVEKNDPTLRRENDSDPETEPVATGYRRLNIMGHWRWRKGGQEITWSFAVPETGLYKIALRVGKFWGDGLPAYRQIAIDGLVPFREMLSHKFAFDRKWRVETLADEEGEPYLFHLSQGEHTLAMTVKMGDLADVIYAVNDDVLLLARVLRQIIMITGSEPDPNYVYDLDEQIPDLLDNFSHLRDQMQWKVDFLTGISVKRPAAANDLLTVKSQLQKALDRPDYIHRRVKDLTTAQESLGSWYLGLQEQPLWVDYFLVAGPEEKIKQDRSNFFQRAVATLKNLVISFTKDYDSIGSVYNEGEEEKKLINVWISRGTEWAEIIKEMVDETFTSKTGIMVNMNILPPSQLNAGAVNALMLAITSGRAPDVACGVSAVSPVEFAIRDAVVDITQFPDHEEILDRFLPRIVEPFRYRGGIYAIPETMDFRALFYRKDIIQELGIELPDTWDDIYTYVLPVLYQNGMDFYYAIPTELGAIDHNFAPFLYQTGGDFYTPDGSRSALDSPEAYRAFKEYCDLYTGYGFPIAANFYMRMRTGEMPLGIGTYGMYMRLAVAAPELAGRWGIAEFPGHLAPDGTIDRTVGGIALESDVIMSNSKYPEAAWEYLKWWSSAETQERFGRELEALIGPEARWNTANIEAFQRLPWKREDLEVVKGSWTWARDMPVVLGGYFTGRHIVNAWNRVVMSTQNKLLKREARTRVLVRDSIEQAVKDINRELRQKQEEYGVESSILAD